MSLDDPAAIAEHVTPPGWYATAYGWQWWDGAQWYPPMPQGNGSDEKTFAILSHLGAFLGGIILPLVFFLLSKDKPYARHHSCEALNFQITYLIAVIGGFAIMFGGFGVFAALSANSDSGAGFFVTFMIGFGLMMVAAIGHTVLSIVGAVKASQMEWWRYPVSIRFVKP